MNDDYRYKKFIYLHCGEETKLLLTLLTFSMKLKGDKIFSHFYLALI